MFTIPVVRACMIAGALALLATVPRGSIPSDAAPPSRRDARSVTPHDGAHDFDFEIGTWHTHLRRLLRPPTGSTTWVVYDGTTTVHKVWGGKANLVELEVDGPAGRIEGLSLRLYDPDTHQWSLNFANSRVGRLATPTIGAFRHGRGVFYDREAVDGRMVLDRFVITEVAPDTCHFEQASSADGGKTWENNWVATDVRVPQGTDASR